MTLKHLLKKPIITEQSLADASKGIFTFEVSREASKTEIAQAVAQYYGVTVIGVRTTIMAAKPYTTRQSRKVYHTPVRKKAKVQLKKGQTIDVFDIEETN